jgi:hypothetical protein
MKIQVIQDDKGRTTGIYIPINQWRELKKKYKGLQNIEQEEPAGTRLISELTEAVHELVKIAQKKKKARPADQLLNEL